jgi:hypothetical protein
MELLNKLELSDNELTGPKDGISTSGFKEDVVKEGTRHKGHQGDRAVLEDLYRATSDDNKTNWVSDKPLHE